MQFCSYCAQEGYRIGVHCMCRLQGPLEKETASQTHTDIKLDHTHCVRATQTPPALEPLPINELKIGDESGWYLSKNKNPDGSRVVHLSDPRYPETVECGSGMAHRERIAARPCRCCLIPLLLVDTPHTDKDGKQRADINDPELLEQNRAYICGRPH